MLTFSLSFFIHSNEFFDIVYTLSFGICLIKVVSTSSTAILLMSSLIYATINEKYAISANLLTTSNGKLSNIYYKQ